MLVSLKCKEVYNILYYFVKHLFSIFPPIFLVKENSKLNTNKNRKQMPASGIFPANRLNKTAGSGAVHRELAGSGAVHGKLAGSAAVHG